MADEKRDEYGLSAEDVKQIQEYMKSHDFTSMLTLQREYNYSGKAADVFAKSKKLISKCWETKLYTDFNINRPMKDFSIDFAVKTLENADTDYISDKIAELQKDPEQLNALVDRFVEMYSDSLAEMLEAFCKSKSVAIEELTDDDLLEFVGIVSEPLFNAFMHVLMIAQNVPGLYDVAKENLSYEDFSNAPNNWDKMNFEAGWTHCKTKLGAPLSLDQLMEEDYDAYERAVSFFDSNTDGEKLYEELRIAFLDTLNSTDREIYEMREQNYTESDIAYKLNYKTHSAVSKRIKIISEKLKSFLDECNFL